jgi:hypothetical protein
MLEASPLCQEYGAGESSLLYLVKRYRDRQTARHTAREGEGEAPLVEVDRICEHDTVRGYSLRRQE